MSDREHLVDLNKTKMAFPLQLLVSLFILTHINDCKRETVTSDSQDEL